MSTRVPRASFRFINRETFKTPYAKWPNSKDLFCDALRDVGGMKKLLEPLPIARIEKTHKYIWEPTGEQLAFSTTQVCNTKTPEQLENIDVKSEIKIDPNSLGVNADKFQNLVGNDAKFNADKMIEIFKGEDNDFSKAVCLNAAAGLIVSERYENFELAYNYSRDFIMSGAPYKHLVKIQNA